MAAASMLVDRPTVGSTMKNTPQPIPCDDDLLAIGSAELKRALPLSRSTVYGLIRDGALPVVKLGRRTFIRRADVRSFIAARNPLIDGGAR